ncbi:MAG: hypothetical protein ABR521_05285 [Gaiellaceae bacterium]
MSARRLLLILALAALAGGALCSPSRAAPGFFVGVDEDSPLWGRAQLATSVSGALGVRAVRVFLPWRRGESKLGPALDDRLERAVAGTWGMRLVVTVHGRADEAPRSDATRAQFCDFAADILRRYPTVNDVVVWNDPNDAAFWSPQFHARGSSAAPADFAALLSRCWSTLHAVRPSANVVAPSVSQAARRRPVARLSHGPAAWYRALGDAYRASKRRQPLFDTVGHVPHAEHSAERPWTKHPGADVVGLGDHGKLMQALTGAFLGTAQPLPGRGRVTIWYLAQGFQTAVEPGKAALYRGRETDRAPLPGRSPAARSDRRTGPAPDHATQLADAIRIASCQPGVGAYFNFLLADEPDLAGWQSGVLWADWSPKPSYSALKQVVADVSARNVDCAAFAKTGIPPRPVAVRVPPAELRITSFRTTSVGAFSGAVSWRTTTPARIRVAYGLPASGRTLWARARTAGLEGDSTLRGLAFATTYRVWLTATTEDGQRAQATLDLRTHGLPASPTPSLDRSAGAMLLDGQPFFPMIVWSQCPDGYGSNVSDGINLFSENPCGGLQAQLDALGGRGLSAAVAGKDGGRGPGLIGYFHPDEADALGFTGDTLPPAPAGVPSSFSFLTLTHHFYSGAAPLPAGRGMYPGLIARADVIGHDLYPLQEWCRPDRMVDVWSSQQELVRLAPQKATFQWIEAADWRCPGGRTAVTPATVRAESWLAIAGGANGLGFFPSIWSPAVGRAIADVSRDVAKLGPALLSPATPVVAAHPLVRAGARSYQGASYVIAVNAGFTATQATIRVPWLGQAPLTVLDENRRVAAIDGAITDSFAPLAVHIYVAEPPER